VQRCGTSMRNKEINRLKDLRRKLKQHSHKLLKMYRAEAIGIGYKHISGKRTEEIVIIFFVKRKLPESELRRIGVQPIPKKLFGCLTDVRETGEFRKY